MRYCNHETAHAYCPMCETDLDVPELQEKLNEALLQIELLENTINDLNLRIAFLES